MSDTRDRIMDVAEDAARRAGYDGFSFRTIAAELGIKSASVHYHFATKPDLGAAIVARYADRFLTGLGDGTDPRQPADAQIDRLVAAFRTMLTDDDRMCLGGLLGVQIGGLPLQVAAEVRHFLARLVAWTEPVCRRRGARDPRAAAMGCVAGLEGALMLGRALNSRAAFDAAAAAAIRR